MKNLTEISSLVPSQDKIPKLDSKRRIIDAAKELFWQHGYKQTSPRTIQEKSNVGQGSFYHHFKSKKELGREVIKEITHELEIAADKSISAYDDPLSRINNYMRSPRKPCGDCRLGIFAFDETVMDDELRRPIEQYLKKIEQYLTNAIEELIDSGKLPENTEAKSMARAMMAVIQGGYVLAKSNNNPEIMYSAINGIMKLLELAANK